jgi:hypothetical protein
LQFIIRSSKLHLDDSCDYTDLNSCREGNKNVSNIGKRYVWEIGECIYLACYDYIKDYCDDNANDIWGGCLKNKDNYNNTNT